MNRNRKLTIWIFIAFILSVILAYGISWAGAHYIQTRFGTRSNCEINAETDALDDETVISQSIEVPFERLQQISVQIAHLVPDTAIDDQACLHLTIREDESILFETETAPLYTLDYVEDSFGKLKPQAFYTILLPENVNIGEGSYTIEIRGEGLDKSSQIGLAVNGETVYVQIQGVMKQHAEERFVFVFLYVLAFALILVRMNYYQGELKSEWLDQCIAYYTLFLFTFTFTYYKDTILTYENARVMKSAIKHGQFFHYYDYAFIQSKYRMNANYNVILFVLFAVCMLPYDIVKQIAGDVPLYYGHMWYNVIVSMMYVFTGFQLKRLLKVWKIDSTKAGIVSLLYFLNPIFLLCTVGFAQLDIFYVSVFLEGLILFEKRKTDKACLVWSVSIAMKTFPLLVAIPLILLREKRIKHILRYAAEAMSVSMISSVIYGKSEGWIANQLHNPHYGKLFANLIPAETGFVSIFFVIYFLIMFYCWTTKQKESYQTTILCGLAVYISFFCFSDWHGQYVAMAGLFLILAALLAEDLRVYLGIEFFMVLGYLFTVWLVSGDGSNFMVLEGVVGGFKYINETPLHFSEFIRGITTFEYPLELAQSLSLGAGVFLTVYCVYSIKKARTNKTDCPAGYIYLPMMAAYLILIASGIISFSS